MRLIVCVGFNCIIGVQSGNSTRIVDFPLILRVTLVQLREAREDLSQVQQRHSDASNKRQELEKQLEISDSEVVTLKSDLKLAFKRIEDLQHAIQGDLSDSDSDLSDR